MKSVFLIVLVLFAVLSINLSMAQTKPSIVIQTKVEQLINEFVANKTLFEQDKMALFDMVDEVTGPIFDFKYISRLVMGKNWKKASEAQRAAFATEFKRLMLVTYASALFKFTGDETMTFTETKIKQRKGVQFAEVGSEISITKENPVPVIYSMLNEGEGWRIYNLTVGSLNMALNYRNVVQSMIHSEGIDGTIQSIKQNNDKNYINIQS